MGGNAFTSFGAAAVPVGGWVELARTTLGSDSDTVTVSSIPDKRYYMVLFNEINSGSIGTRLQIGNGTIDTSTNYAYRLSTDGASDSTVTSTTRLISGAFGSGGASPAFNLLWMANLSAKEKLVIGRSVLQQTAGSGVPPARKLSVDKWVNTSSVPDIFTWTNSDSGSFGTGAEAIILGWDPTDVHTTNFWEEIFSEQLTSDNQNFSTGAITAKKYLWLQFYQVGMTGNAAWRFNGDSTTSYSRRHEINGAADAIVTSQTSLLNVLTGGTGDRQTFTNAFIVNNSALNKLILFETVFGPTGAGTAPGKILGVCKWDEVAAQITSMTVDDSGAGFDTGSFLKIWGAN